MAASTSAAPGPQDAPHGRGQRRGARRLALVTLLIAGLAVVAWLGFHAAGAGAPEGILRFLGMGDPKHPTGLQGAWRLKELRAGGGTPQNPVAAGLQAQRNRLLAEKPVTMALEPKGGMVVAVVGGSGSRRGWEVDGQQVWN